jgi:hypothetical protein
MTAALLSQLIQSLMALIGLVLTTLIGIYVPRAIAAFEARTAVHLTQQQRDAIMGAVTTEAGLIQNDLNTGLLKATDIRPNNPVMQQRAAQMLDRVPASAQADGTTRDTAAKLIVARVDTSAKPVAVVPVAG